MSNAVQRVSELVYGPLAQHLTNVSHLIVCPDGQLSRLPFEMLRRNGKFLLEEKTISYVGSGREIVRLAGPAKFANTNAPLVLGLVMRRYLPGVTTRLARVLPFLAMLAICTSGIHGSRRRSASG